MELIWILLAEMVSFFPVIQGQILDVAPTLNGVQGSSIKLWCKYTGLDSWFAVQWRRKARRDGGFKVIATLSPKDDALFSNQIDVSFKRRLLPEVSDEFNSVQFDIEVFSLECSDVGVYECSILTLNGMLSKETNLTLKVPPSTPQIAYDVLVIEHNESFPLKCSANIGYPAAFLQWYAKFPGDTRFRLVEGKQQRMLKVYDECTMEETRTINISLSQKTNGTVYRCQSERWITSSSGFSNFDEVIVKLPVTPKAPSSGSELVIIEDTYASFRDRSGAPADPVQYVTMIVAQILLFLVGKT